jgi:hypothetical protein
MKAESNSDDAQILEGVVAPEDASLAKAVLKLGFQPSQKAEIERLLERNDDGKMTSKQKTRLEAYVRVGNFLSLLKAKARSTLSASS